MALDYYASRNCCHHSLYQQSWIRTIPALHVICTLKKALFRQLCVKYTKSKKHTDLTYDYKLYFGTQEVDFNSVLKQWKHFLFTLSERNSNVAKPRCKCLERESEQHPQAFCYCLGLESDLIFENLVVTVKKPANVILICIMKRLFSIE
jgi:hypothetical protein